MLQTFHISELSETIDKLSHPALNLLNALNICDRIASSLSLYN